MTAAAKGEGMYLRFFCLAAVCLLMARCAGTGRKIMPEYEHVNVEKSRLGIVLFKENMAMHNIDDIADVLGGGEPREVLHGFLASRFRELAIKDGKFGAVEIINGCDTSGFTKSTQFLASDDPVQLRVPSKNACTGDSAAFLLFLDRFEVSRDRKTGTTMVSTGPYGTMRTTRVGASDKLILKGTFALWDNLAGKIVAFGKISQKTDVVTAITKQTWIAAVESIASKIFVDTPYGIQSVYK